MCVPQDRARIDAQFFDESLTHLPIRLERLRLPTTAVLGEHQLTGDTFIQRMPLQRRRELTEQLLVPPDVQESVVSVQFSRKSLLLKGSPHIVHPRVAQSSDLFSTPHL